MIKATLSMCVLQHHIKMELFTMEAIQVVVLNLEFIVEDTTVMDMTNYKW